MTMRIDIKAARMIKASGLLFLKILFLNLSDIR